MNVLLLYAQWETDSWFVCTRDSLRFRNGAVEPRNNPFNVISRGVDYRNPHVPSGDQRRLMQKGKWHTRCGNIDLEGKIQC